jgi:hypothetical protein
MNSYNRYRFVLSLPLYLIFSGKAAFGRGLQTL